MSSRKKTIFAISGLAGLILAGTLLFTALKAEEERANLEFTISIPKDTFLHLETVTITSTVTNTGQEAVEVMLPSAQEDAINFQMRRDGGEWGSFWGPDSVPHGKMVNLQPRDSISSEYDLFGWGYNVYIRAEHYPPGSYELKALYRAKKPAISSNTLKFKIVKPQITDREYVAYKFLMRALTDPNSPARIEGDYTYEKEFLQRFPQSIYVNTVRLYLATDLQSSAPTKSLEHSLAVLKNNPTYCEKRFASYNSGYCYERLGKFARAIEMYKNCGSQKALWKARRLEAQIKSR